MVVPLSLYLCFPSCRWNFDGVACAAALELGDPVFFFHSNHLLYGFLGYGFWKALAFFFQSVRALPALQVMNPLLSAIGLIGIYRLLLHETRQPILALGLTWIMSVTAVFWVWSLEAQVYPLGFAALAWATYFLIASSSRRKYIWAGLFHGLAVLGHVIHLLWIIPALYWMKVSLRGRASSCSEGRPGRSNLDVTAESEIATLLPVARDDSKRIFRIYLVTLISTILIPYLIVFFFVLIPSHRGFPWILTWLKGSTGLTPDRSFAWHWAGWTAPLLWLKGNFLFFWGAFSPYGNSRVGIIPWIATFLSMGLLGMGFLFSLRHRLHPIWKFSLLWIAVYALFLWTWEPLTVLYRMADIVPFGLLLATGIAYTPKKSFHTLWIFGLFAVTLISNYATLIRPMHRPENNTAYQQTLALMRQTPSNALYLMRGGIPWIYLLYFGGRPARNIGLLSPSYLKIEVARHKQRGPVFADVSLLQDAAVQTWLSAYRFRPVANLPWVELL